MKNCNDIEPNIIFNQDFLTNALQAKSVQLIIADPPYFEVKGDFDFTWSSFEAYLQDVRKWAAECAMSIREGRNCIGYEIDPKYAAMGNERIQAETQQPRLIL